MYMYVHVYTYIQKEAFPTHVAWIVTHPLSLFYYCLIPVVACLDRDQILALFQSMESISYSQDPSNNQTQYHD